MPRACALGPLLLVILACSRGLAFDWLALSGLSGLFPPSGVACGLQCNCNDSVLSCVGTESFVLENIPAVKPHNNTFDTLDFSNNRISTIEKGAWHPYPWTETLILKNNLLERIDADALDGLDLLKFLDLSCNAIILITPRVFDPVSLLHHLDLSGNNISAIQNGTFGTWHELPFLTDVVLSRNPLEELEDTSLFSLKALKKLDLGSSMIPVETVEDLMTLAPRLEKAVLSLFVTCCLCLAEMENGVLSKSVVIQCPKDCYIGTLECGPAGNIFEDHALVRSVRDHRVHFNTTLRIEPETPSETCKDKMPEPPPRMPEMTIIVIIASALVVSLVLVVGGLAYCLRKCTKRRAEDPPEKSMEEGSSSSEDSSEDSSDE